MPSDSLSDMIFRNLSPGRVVALGFLVMVGFLFSGCTAEYIKNIDKAAKTLRASEEFSAVNFEYERGLDPITRQRILYDFSAVLEPDADLEEAGRLLAEAHEISGRAPDVLIDEHMWLNGFHDHRGQRRAPELTAQGWTEVLEIARTTNAQEVEVWDWREHYAEEYDEHDPSLALKVFSMTDDQGWDRFEELAAMEMPDEIEQFDVEFYAGMENRPQRWTTPGPGEYQFMWYAGVMDRPVELSGGSDTNIWQARELLEAAREHFNEVYAFSLHYTQDDVALIEVVYPHEAATCEKNEAYAQLVDDTLDDDVGITISVTHEPDGWPKEMYEQVSDASAERGHTSEGCLPNPYE